MATHFQTSQANIVSLPNPYFNTTPNHSTIEYILVNTEPTNIYTGGIGWSLNTMSTGAANKGEAHVIGYNNGSRRNITRRKGIIPFYNFTSDFNNIYGENPSYPPGILSLDWPPPQIHNSVTILSENDIDIGIIDKEGGPQNKYISAIQIQTTGHYTMLLARKIRDQFQSNQKNIYTDSNKYKYNIYFLIFKAGTTYKQIGDYLISSYPIGLNKGQPPIYDQYYLKYPPTPGNYLSTVLTEGDIVVAFSVKGVRECIFSGKYNPNILTYHSEKSKSNIVPLLNPYYLTQYYVYSVKVSHLQQILVNTEPTNLYTAGIGWSIDTLNGPANETNVIKHKRYRKYKQWKQLCFTNSRLGSVTTVTNDQFGGTGDSTNIAAIQIETQGYYTMLLARQIRDQFQSNQKNIYTNTNIYKEAIYILIFSAGTNYISIRNYVYNFAGVYPIHSPAAVPKYTPQPGNYCKALLDVGDIVIAYSKHKINQCVFSGIYMGQTAVCTFTKN